MLLAHPSDSGCCFPRLPLGLSLLILMPVPSHPPQIHPEIAAREDHVWASCFCPSQHNRKGERNSFSQRTPHAQPCVRRSACFFCHPLSHLDETGRHAEVNTDPRLASQLQSHFGAGVPEPGPRSLQVQGCEARRAPGSGLRHRHGEGRPDSGRRAQRGPAHFCLCCPVSTVFVHVDQRLCTKLATGHGPMSGAF